MEIRTIPIRKRKQVIYQSSNQGTKGGRASVSAATRPPSINSSSDMSVQQAPVDISELNAEKLDTLVKKSDQQLISVQTVFPFDFFPDSITVDENKIDIVHGIFFFSSSISSILIKDIKYAHVSYNPFFATLNIEVAGFEQNPEKIPYLKKRDADKLLRIIIGLVTLSKEKIDVTKLNNEELLQKVEKIGAAPVVN